MISPACLLAVKKGLFGSPSAVSSVVVIDAEPPPMPADDNVEDPPPAPPDRLDKRPDAADPPDPLVPSELELPLELEELDELEDFEDFALVTIFLRLLMTSFQILATSVDRTALVDLPVPAVPELPLEALVCPLLPLPLEEFILLSPVRCEMT